MTAPALPPEVERLVNLADEYSSALSTALRAAIARALPPPVAPSFDATLDDLAVDVDYSPDRGTTTTIVGLDDVRAAHAEAVRVAVEAEREACADVVDDCRLSSCGYCANAIRARGAKS